MVDKLIFIVDDDRVILNLLEYTFKSKEGFEVKTFSSGEDCLENLGMNPDLIVLDHLFYLQGSESMTGLDTLIELKKRKNNVPVIILSAQDDITVVKEFIKNGATKYIPKADYFVDALVESVDMFIVN
jgi:DNA-binding NtrC family response regulator